MSHSLIDIWLHIIFSTKDREPLIASNFDEKLYSHIKHKLINEFDSFVEIVNGTENHIHILMKQSPNFSLSQIIKNIKGESSHWINENNLTGRKFIWQTGYAAFSLSIDKLENVKNYIGNQKEHHKKYTFLEEMEKYSKIYGFDKSFITMD